MSIIKVTVVNAINPVTSDNYDILSNEKCNFCVTKKA